MTILGLFMDVCVIAFIIFAFSKNFYYDKNMIYPTIGDKIINIIIHIINIVGYSILSIMIIDNILGLLS